MSETTAPDSEPAPRRKWRTALREALLVLLVGLIFALLANQVSPRGLTLSRNYFPAGHRAVPPAQPTPSTQTNTTRPAAPLQTPPRPPAARTEQDTARARLLEKGLNLVEGKAAQQLYRDPQYEQELIVFVDARDDRHYSQGHIPGAYQFDHYYPQNYLPTVVPACLNASKVVVYCTGGNCEDSEFAALTLIEAGVPKDRVFVYTGGITEWIASAQPIETGDRKSGKMQPAKL